MKKIVFILMVTILILAAYAPVLDIKSGMHGMIEPADGAKKAWAIMGTDSVSTVPVAGGFSLELKPGTWMLVIEAVPPYKNHVIQNIFVQENQSTDVGVLKLTQ